MTDTITAPDGAIFALLAIDAKAPIVPDDFAETWLQEHGLAAFSRDGSILEVTDKGRAFIRMIGATPLPVRVERWDDPRGAELAAPAPAAQPGADLLAGLAQLIAAASKVAPQSAADRYVAAERPPAQPAGPVVIPPGFTPVKEEWTRLPFGQWPAELPPDLDVMTMWRDGRIKKGVAVQSVIWTHRDKFDDVIAIKSMGNDTIIPVTSLTPVN